MVSCQGPSHKSIPGEYALIHQLKSSVRCFFNLGTKSSIPWCWIVHKTCCAVLKGEVLRNSVISLLWGLIFLPRGPFLWKHFQHSPHHEPETPRKQELTTTSNLLFLQISNAPASDMWFIGSTYANPAFANCRVQYFQKYDSLKSLNSLPYFNHVLSMGVPKAIALRLKKSANKTKWTPAALEVEKPTGWKNFWRNAVNFALVAWTHGLKGTKRQVVINHWFEVSLMICENRIIRQQEGCSGWINSSWICQC